MVLYFQSQKPVKGGCLNIAFTRLPGCFPPSAIPSNQFHLRRVRLGFKTTNEVFY
jgi:hypothetical protein